MTPRNNPEKQSSLNRQQTEMLSGLLAEKKFIPSRFFYDDRGSDLFAEITRLPEYYLTRKEYEIIDQRGGEIARLFEGRDNVHIAELGAGDGHKTFRLLRHFTNREIIYSPIDISKAALHDLAAGFRREFADRPDWRLQPVEGEYLRSLKQLVERGDAPDLLLFLGSNIGNYSAEAALSFLRRVRENLTGESYFFCGFDLKKSPRILIPAYSDSRGVTAEFNLNLLDRFNRELGADFRRENFEHYATWNAESGAMESYLIALREHTVHIRSAGMKIRFRALEPIHTEVSCKYSAAEMETIASRAGFSVAVHLSDADNFFVDSLWKVENPSADGP